MFFEDLKIIFSALNLRTKLFIYFLIFNFLITLTLGLVLFRISYAKFYQSFIDQKVSVGLSVSRTIDSDQFPSFTNYDMIHDQDYEFLFEKMKQTLKEESNITSISSVLLSRKGEKLIYAVDGTINDRDSIWITNNLIGLKFYLDEYARPVVFWNDTEYRDDFFIKVKDYLFYIQVIDNEQKSLLINGETIFTVTNISPLQVFTSEGSVDSKNIEREIYIKDPVTDQNFFLRLHLAKVEDPAFVPGQVYEEVDEKLRNVFSSIQYCRTYSSPKPETSIFGNFLYIVVPILGNESKCIGAVILHISPRNIVDFRNSMLLATIGISFMTFLVTIFISYLISGLFVAPLTKLTSAVQEISLGNLDVTVSIPSSDEFGFLATKFNEMVTNLKKAYQDTAYLAVIKNELEIARHIQESILPKEIPSIKGLNISVVYEPMAQVGGDFYDFSVLEPDQFGVIIADVAGHGVPAAIIASMFKVAYSVESKKTSDPASTLEGINKIMLDKCGTHFLTACCLHLDLKKKVATLAKAGHPPIYIVNQKTKKIQEFKSKGRLIGVYEDIRADNLRIKLKKYDRILLFTDGVMEVTNPKDETFGEENFKKFILDYANVSIGEFKKLLMSRLLEWKASILKDFSDDITLVVIDIE